MANPSAVCLLVALLTVLALCVRAQRSEYSRNYTYTTRYYAPSTVVPSSRFRYECRNVFPLRSDIVPHGVVFSGYVDDIKQDSNDDDHGYMASVTVRRVFFGPRNLRRARVTVAGFGDNAHWCHSNVRRGDSWIFVLQPITYPDYFRLNSSLIKINLNNLEKIDAIVQDEPYRKMTSVTDLPCEKKYCKNNGICLEDKFSADGTKCECLTYCKKNYAPVCGSNDETFTNECELRLKSCYAAKNWFVKSPQSCQYADPYSPATSIGYSSSYRSTSNVPSPGSSYSSSTYRVDSRSSPLAPLPPPLSSSSSRRDEPPSRTYTRTHTIHTTINRSYQS